MVCSRTREFVKPPTPAGWQIVSDDEISVPSSICRDVESRPWNYGFTRTFRQVGDAEARQKVMEDAAAASAAAFELKQPRLDAIMARMTKFNEQMVALVQKGDYAGAEALNVKMAKLQEEYQKVADEGDDEERIASRREDRESRSRNEHRGAGHSGA